ncbi:hypothetical protein Bca4012_001751 [Brassica carinata]|uniref:BnaC03g17380D protein n=5 Tax=Brassica TaxID=3705 RepID=A0A078GH33_BRANA|nr:hypothetical protein Bca52824_043438 [Brassica carinata]KAH0889310.1 hypothetical protein HID58_051739 [Brassica napus]CAF1699684.1 unnamed protein product [Brassica napus]CDY23953.1 BnaC03g17380D [Brassica napus]VDC88678.1 unnamed protein product [Brassica oleracea]
MFSSLRTKKALTFLGLSKVLILFLNCDWTLGYEVSYVRNLTDVDDKVLEQLKEKALKSPGMKEDHMLQRVKERTNARKNKEYERCDAIRKELANVGTALMNSPGGTTWRPAIPQDSATTT